MLSGNIEKGIFIIFQACNVNKQESYKDKRVVTDLRQLNMRIAKNNLVYPLIKDTFLVLGSSKCKLLSILDLKDPFHSLRLSEDSKKYCGILPCFGSALLISENDYGIKHFPLNVAILHKCDS